MPFAAVKTQFSSTYLSRSQISLVSQRPLELEALLDEAVSMGGFRAVVLFCGAVASA
jgi:hypothetical protein